jgi:hypothetical protein
MLKIILMQNEGNYDIDEKAETYIVFFACLRFFFSSLGLIRNKFVANGEVKQWREISMLLREHSFFSWGGGPEEFGGGSSNFDVLQRGGSSYSFGIN